MRVSFVTILLVTLALTSCERSRTSGNNSPSAVALTPQALPSLPLQIDLPRDAKVQPRSSGVNIVMNPGLRAPLSIDIRRDDTNGSFLGPNAKTLTLTSSLQLTYQEEVLPAEGSGGEEHVLDGWLTLAQKTYRITCSQQSESSSAAQACLPILATLRSFAQDK